MRFERVKASLEKIKNFFPCFFILIPLSVVIVRAVCSAITYDEAYTYLFYALPLSEKTSIDLLMNMSKTSLLNNHWLNTVLIAFFTSLFKVKYNEFIIRIPVLLFAITFYFFAARCVSKKIISWFEFIFLIFAYYLNEFFGLARGYGISAALVFFALVYYRKFILDSSLKNVRMCFYMLLLSTYANSSCLLIVFAFCVVACVYLMRKNIFVEFLRKNLLHLVIWGIGFFYITLFHFKVSEPGKPVYMVNDVNVLFYIKQYFFLCTYHLNFSDLFFYFLGISFAALVVLSLVVKDFDNFQFVLLFLLYLLILLVIPLVFKRGTLLFRTLIPSYPLFVFCIGVMFRNVESMLHKKNLYFFYGAKCLLFVVCCLLFL